MRVQRHASGSVRYDKRRKTWNYLWYDGATRRSKRIGTKQEFPTKAAAWKEVESLEIQQPKPQNGDTVRSVITRYEAERMPHVNRRRGCIALSSTITYCRSGAKRGFRTYSPARLNCGSVSCPCRQSPRRTCDHSCTGLWSLRCGPACWTSAAIQSLWSRTSEQREGYARRVASRRSSSTLC